MGRTPPRTQDLEATRILGMEVQDPCLPIKKILEIAENSKSLDEGRHVLYSISCHVFGSLIYVQGVIEI